MINDLILKPFKEVPRAADISRCLASMSLLAAHGDLQQQNGPLSLVEICRDCDLIGWIMMMLMSALLCHKITAQGTPSIFCLCSVSVFMAYGRL